MPKGGGRISLHFRCKYIIFFYEFQRKKDLLQWCCYSKEGRHLYFQSVIEINLMLQFTLYYKKTPVGRNSNVFYKYVYHRRKTEKNNPVKNLPINWLVVQIHIANIILANWGEVFLVAFLPIFKSFSNST